MKGIQSIESADRCTITGRLEADFEDGKPILRIETIHGDIAIVRVGDWIIKENTLGKYYPIKNEIFIRDYIKIKYRK